MTKWSWGAFGRRSTCWNWNSYSRAAFAARNATLRQIHLTALYARSTARITSIATRKANNATHAPTADKIDRRIGSMNLELRGPSCEECGERSAVVFVPHGFDSETGYVDETALCGKCAGVMRECAGERKP